MEKTGEKDFDTMTPVDFESRHFVEYVENNFEELWKEIEKESESLSKKDLAKKMFILGNVVCRETISNLIVSLEEEYSKNPEAFVSSLEEENFGIKA